MVHSDNQTHAAAAAAPRPAIATVAELRASGHAYETVKDEIRRNLLAAMRAGEHRFPGIIGFDQTVIPQLERALLAGHDTMLLGERGQGKTRLIRTLPGLLDEWTPAVAGCEINDHPYQPACARCRRLAAEQGDALPITWRHRSERYGEKLATPDTSVGDLIGDIDPVKVAEGRTLGDPETIHFGLVPRTNRGIFCLTDELTLIRQEADIWTAAELPEHLVEVIARFTRGVRESPAVDARSGVSARFAIAAAESAAASAVRRSALAGPQADPPVARVCDLPAVVSTLRGKVEFEVSEEGREEEVLGAMLRRAIAETFRSRLGSVDLSGLLTKFEEGGTVESGELVPATELLQRVGDVPGLARIMSRLGMEGGESFEQAAAAVEFALEGL